jgi:hypothetical protein
MQNPRAMPIRALAGRARFSESKGSSRLLAVFEGVKKVAAIFSDRFDIRGARFSDFGEFVCTGVSRKKGASRVQTVQDVQALPSLHGLRRPLLGMAGCPEQAAKPQYRRTLRSSRLRTGEGNQGFASSRVPGRRNIRGRFHVSGILETPIGAAACCARGVLLTG